MGTLWVKLLGSPAKGSNLCRVTPLTPASCQPGNCPAHGPERRKEGSHPNAPLRWLLPRASPSSCEHTHSLPYGCHHTWHHAANEPRRGLGRGLGVREALSACAEKANQRSPSAELPVKL